MGINKNNFERIIKNTDNLISREMIGNLSKRLSKSIEIIIQSCNFLFGKSYALFLTGSLAFCLRSESLKEFRISGDKSDIDLWIIIANPPNKTLKLSNLEKKIIQGFSRLVHFDIACIPFSSGNLKISLKIMDKETAKKILQIKNINLYVFRHNSLKKAKEKNIFYGIKKIHNIPILEKKLRKEGFLWQWPTNFFIKKDFVLNDIHSCFLIGGFLIDDIGLRKRRDLFLKKFLFNLKKIQEKNIIDNSFKILQYFYNRFPLSAKKIFGR